MLALPSALVNGDVNGDRILAEERIAAGLSVDVEDALRAGKAALKAEQRRQDAKRAKLREAVDEGDASGVAEDSSLEGILRDIRSRPRSLCRNIPRRRKWRS